MNYIRGISDRRSIQIFQKSTILQLQHLPKPKTLAPELIVTLECMYVDTEGQDCQAMMSRDFVEGSPEKVQLFPAAHASPPSRTPKATMTRSPFSASFAETP